MVQDISGNEAEHEVSETPVVQFYEKRSIFITGATGFLGKVLVSSGFYLTLYREGDAWMMVSKYEIFVYKIWNSIFVVLSSFGLGDANAPLQLLWLRLSLINLINPNIKNRIIEIKSLINYFLNGNSHFTSKVLLYLLFVCSGVKVILN